MVAVSELRWKIDRERVARGTHVNNDRFAPRAALHRSTLSTCLLVHRIS
jgi:hypothetical protein